MKRVLLNTIIVLTTAIVLPCLSFASEQRAHVHGGAKLQVAIDGNTVTLMLEGPMDSLLGFEHAPGNEAEKAALAKLVSALNKPDALFVFSSAAGCVSSTVKLDSILITDTAHDDNHEHEHEHEHEHDNNKTHSDLDGEFSFVCKEAGKLTGLTVNLFDIAANLQDLDAEVAGPRGQVAYEMTSKTRSISW